MSQLSSAAAESASVSGNEPDRCSAIAAGAPGSAMSKIDDGSADIGIAYPRPNRPNTQPHQEWADRLRVSLLSAELPATHPPTTGGTHAQHATTTRPPDRCPGRRRIREGR